MSVTYYGDFPEDATVYIPFNTFDSNDPTASVTITNLADADIHVHKDGHVDEIVTDGATVVIDFDSITGNHMITIDTSVDAAYATGSDYEVRIEGTTVDAGTINGFIGTFSIENRFNEVTVTSIGADVITAAAIASSAIDNATFAADVGSTAYATNIIALAVRKSLDEIKLDHLIAIADADDVVDDSIIAKLASVAGDWSTFDEAVSSLTALSSLIGGVGGGSGSLNKECVTDPTVTTGTGNPAGPPTSYTNTQLQDALYHQTAVAVTDDLEVYYEFALGGDEAPIEALLFGRYHQDATDKVLVTVTAYNWGITTFETIGSFDGKKNSAAKDDKDKGPFKLLSRHVGTGVNLGLVRIGFEVDEAGASADNGELYVNQLLISYTSTSKSVGYSNGSIWVDTINGSAGTENYVNGTADNPVLTWADALTISASLGLTSFNIGNGSTITLTSDSSNYSFFGTGWLLVLNGQSIDGAYVHGACTVSGTGTNGATRPVFEHCCFGIVTLPPSELRVCGIGISDGQFTGQAAGEFILDRCYSVVAGSGTPDLVFTGLGSATGINNRGWKGGVNYTLDSDCTLSHEVLAGGTTTVSVNGAAVEIRGIARELIFNTLTGGEVVRFVGITGHVTLNGTTVGSQSEISIYGVSTDMTDNSAGLGCDVDIDTVNYTDVQSILSDTNELQTDWTDGGRLDLILDAVPADVWTVASARTVDYGTLLEQICDWHFNEKTVVDATGGVTLRNKGDSADLATWGITDNATITVSTEVAFV